MTEDLALSGDFDQEIDADGSWLLNRIDEVIKEARERKDAFVALNFCMQLKSVIKTSGLGLAKLLYLIYHYWDEFGMEDEFEDVVYSHVGVHRHTVDRYIRVWGMYAEGKVPQQFADEIRQKNIRDQIPIANALVQGYDIEQKDWENLAAAPDYNSVSQIIMEDVKGKEPRKSALHITIDGMGVMWVKKGDEPRQLVGTLEIHSESEIVKMAIQRIMKNAGIVERI